MRKDVLYNFIMDGLIQCLIAGSLAQALLFAMSFSISYLQILFINAGFYLLYKLVSWNKWTLTATGCFSTLYLFLTLRKYSLQQLWDGCAAYFIWLVNFIQNNMLTHQGYMVLTQWLVIIILSLIFFILLFKLHLFILPLLTGAVILYTLWFIGHTNNQLVFWIFCLGILLVWMGKSHRLLSRQYKVPHLGFWQLCALPIAVIIIVTTQVVIPDDTNHLKSAFLNQRVQQLEDIFTNYTSYKAPRQPFRLSQTGFPSSQEQLGGPVQTNNDIALHVTSPLSLYLRGSILNEYTSTGWTDTMENLRYRFSDRAWRQLRLAVYDYQEPVWEQLDDRERALFYPHIEAEIIHTGIVSSVLFNVNKLHNLVRVNSYFTPHFNSLGETFASRILQQNESYRLEAHIPNLNNASFQQYLRDRIPSVDWREDLPELLWDNAVYQQRLLTIQQYYTGLPEKLPVRVYDLVDTLTGHLSNDFDKVLAIQDYLQNNFSYTLSPPHTPAERDFVDYFLFELKEGYCTYFATAMAVMGRAAGLPTRYVEGFVMPSTPNSQGIYEVLNSNGHAWVEVYFPWVGWLPFDPTPPGFNNQTPGAGSYSGEDNPYWDAFWQQYLEDDIDSFQPIYPIHNEQNQTNILNIILFNVLPWLFIVLILCLCAIAFLIFLLYRLKCAAIAKQDYTHQFSAYYLEILWLLKLYGSPIQQGETPYVYADRVDQWLVNPIGTMMDISRLLVASSYGSYVLSKEDINKVHGFYSHLMKTMIRVLGIPKFYIKLFVHLIPNKRRLTQ